MFNFLRRSLKNKRKKRAVNAEWKAFVKHTLKPLKKKLRIKKWKIK